MTYQKVVRLTKKEKLYGLRMIHFYRRHPVLAVRDIMGLPVTAPHFRIALKAAWFSDHSILLLSRGMMKSTINAIISILKSILYPNRTQLILGPLFRHGKMIFEESGIEKILSDRMGKQVHRKGFCNISCINTKKIINKGSNDLWKVKFKNGSQIITGPLGKKGESLLGTRANDIRLDEMRDFSKYQVTKVIHPFANVLADPFTNAAEDESFEGNTFMYGGTIRYTDDYYYEIIEEYRARMSTNKDLEQFGFCPRVHRGTYCMVEFNYEDAFKIKRGVKRPKKLDVAAVDTLTKDKNIKFFFRVNIEDIEEGKFSDTINEEDWLAENKNYPIKLGSKEFPYILLKSVSDDLEIENSRIENAEHLFPEALHDVGFKNSKDFCANLEPLLESKLPTVMGVDVATESDKFAITIIRPGTLQGNTFDHIIYAFAMSHMSYSDMREKIYECIEKFSVILVHMDKRGGGTALRDMLREPEDKTRASIVDEGTDEKARSHKNRLNILRMVNATAEYNTTVANTIKAKFQAKKLLMPKMISVHPNEEMSVVYKDLLALRSQFGKVKTKQVGRGWKNYYIPESKSSDVSLERGYKDLFSATLYATAGLIELVENDKTSKKRTYNIPIPKWINIG